MNIIKIDNTSKYEEYEKLLLEKQALIKEAFHIKLKYIHNFGDLLNEIFKNQIVVIRLKKMIAFCVQKQNTNQEINKIELEDYLEKELNSYYVELEEMLKQKSEIDEEFNKASLTNEQMKELKSLYYKIAKLLHPDLHPEDFNDKMSELWEKACLYYECNDLEALNEIYDAVLIYIKDPIDVNLEIIDIDNKINKLKEAIENIVTSVPFIYKYDLINEDSIKLKREELENYNQNILLYIEELEEAVSEFDIVHIVI